MKINNRRTDEESLNGAAQQAALAKLKELGRWPANLILTYPEDEYMLRDNVTPDQLHKLAEWINENTKR
jgi:hypothetical protein